MDLGPPDPLGHVVLQQHLAFSISDTLRHAAQPTPQHELHQTVGGGVECA